MVLESGVSDELLIGETSVILKTTLLEFPRLMTVIVKKHLSFPICLGPELVSPGLDSRRVLLPRNEMWCPNTLQWCLLVDMWPVFDEILNIQRARNYEPLLVKFVEPLTNYAVCPPSHLPEVQARFIELRGNVTWHSHDKARS